MPDGVVDHRVVADHGFVVRRRAGAGVRKREAQVNRCGRVGLDEERIGAFDGVGAIEFGAHRGELAPAVKIGGAGPKQQVVDEVRHGVAEAGVEHRAVGDHETPGPVVALKVTRRTGPQSAQRGTAQSAEFAREEALLEGETLFLDDKVKADQR